MKITLEPTGKFETINQGNGRVQCRIWKGMTEDGHQVEAYIPCVGLHTDAPQEAHQQWERELRAVKTERQLVSFDMRMVI